MQYAFVNKIKTEPQKGIKGYCIECGNEVIAKCGNIKVHHWSHKTKIECDTWWEPETVWHREWKNKFSEDYREIPFFDELRNEHHRADIHTAKGITIEFQNSPISLEEMQSRDAFYSKLVWVINGEKFKNRFLFTRQIPNPNDPILDNFEFAGLVYFKKSDIINSNQGDLLLVYGSNHSEFENLQLSNSHYAFTWKNAHNGWFESKSPVFIDLGDNYLYWLRKRDQVSKPFWYVQVIKKTEFIDKYST